MTIKNNQIKSKERVRDLAEVFTNEREVNSMLDLVKLNSENIESTFLEPSCGNGNFLIGILRRKLNVVKVKYKKQIDLEFYILKSISTIYGVDISEENIAEARHRMLMDVKDFYFNSLNTKKPNEGFWESVKYIIEKNIVVGNMLDGKSVIKLLDYSSPKPYFIKKNEFWLRDHETSKKGVSLLDELYVPLKSYKVCKYLEIYAET
jgi:hypothetical protein